MSMGDWFKGGTPLQLAIERGLKPGGELVAELDALEDYTIQSKRDAQAICHALEAIDRKLTGRGGNSPLFKMAGLFQDTEAGSDACEYLREHGTILLIKLARQAYTEAGFDKNHFLFILKVLAAYGTTEGADLIVEVAQSGYASDAYLWSVVLGMFSSEHPEARRVFTALSDPLPDQFLAISLLDAANQLWLEGGEMRHPFDSDQGVARLESWLRDSNPGHFSYASSATVALPFIQHPRQDDLLAIASSHPDVGVQLEAAWAAAKLERCNGLAQLAAICKEVNHSSRAKHYLKELGREDVIPKESEQPDFVAKAEFAQWLAHPNELARFPDELEIIDHRDLRWPIDGEVRHFWLIKFRAKDTTGLERDQVDVGFVGNGIWCHFLYNLTQRHPEDAYAIHCYWQLEGENLVTDNEVNENCSEYDSLFKDWSGAPLEAAKLLLVSELNHQLGYPRRLVGLASAQVEGQGGWVALDGPESHWYPEDQMPEAEDPKTILMMHIGRRLLGFEREPDRKRLLETPTQLPPEQIERVYEKLLLDAECGSADRREDLLGSGGLLSKHLEAYIEAKISLHGGSKTQYLMVGYERLLNIARQHPESSGKLLDSFSVLGNGFDQYVSALMGSGRRQEIIPLIELFTPHFQHNLGYGRLATAGFKAGRDDIAEKFCLLLKEGLEDWQRAEEMSYLAEVWLRQGRTRESRSLLLECLRKMLEESRAADGSDRKFFEESFQNHRRTFLRLFAGESLSSYGIPETTLD